MALVKAQPSATHVDYCDTTLPTFGVRVSPKGTKTFILKIHNGRQSIGRYPIISLADARKQAKKLLAEKTLGKVRPHAITFPEAVRLFVEDKKRQRRATTAEQYEWFLGRLGLTGYLAAITPHDFARRLKLIKSPSTYDHVLVAARIFFNWAIKRCYIEKNPTAGLSPNGTKKRKRVLSDEELRAIWQACSDMENDLPEHYRVIVKLLMLTGQRRGEIAALKDKYYSHNQQTVCLPSELTKNKREHTFPIGAFCAGMLLEATQSNRHTSDTTSSKTTASIALLFPARGKTTKPFNGWSKSKKALDKACGVTLWTLHDLRRTFRSNLGRLGVAPHIAERLVNHISSQSDMEQTYDHYPYLPEMRDAIERWENHLMNFLAAPQQR